MFSVDGSDLYSRLTLSKVWSTTDWFGDVWVRVARRYFKIKKRRSYFARYKIKNQCLHHSLVTEFMKDTKNLFRSILTNYFSWMPVGLKESGSAYHKMYFKQICPTRHVGLQEHTECYYGLHPWMSASWKLSFTHSVCIFVWVDSRNLVLFISLPDKQSLWNFAIMRKSNDRLTNQKINRKLTDHKSSVNY